MADQVPQYFGLEESIDQTFIKAFEVLFRYYLSQQGEPIPIDLRAIWNKMDSNQYPFVGVLTTLDRFQPISIGDRFYEPNNQVDFFNTINDVEIGVLIQTEEIRELQRLRAFIETNLQWGINPNEGISWARWFRNNGIILNDGFKATPYERVGFESVVQRTDNAQGRELMRRADVETLWQSELTICCQVECACQVSNIDIARGVITNITLAVSPKIS